MRFEEYFDTSEVAMRVGVSRCTVCTLIRRGEIKAVDIGYGTSKPRWRIRESDLRDYMNRAYPMR